MNKQKLTKSRYLAFWAIVLAIVSLIAYLISYVPSFFNSHENEKYKEKKIIIDEHILNIKNSFEHSSWLVTPQGMPDEKEEEIESFEGITKFVSPSYIASFKQDVTEAISVWEMLDGIPYNNENESLSDVIIDLERFYKLEQRFIGMAAKSYDDIRIIDSVLVESDIDHHWDNVEHTFVLNNYLKYKENLMQSSLKEISVILEKDNSTNLPKNKKQKIIKIVSKLRKNQELYNLASDYFEYCNKYHRRLVDLSKYIEQKDQERDSLRANFK